jgi:CBS domain-containing protein
MTVPPDLDASLTYDLFRSQSLRHLTVLFFLVRQPLVQVVGAENEVVGILTRQDLLHHNVEIRASQRQEARDNEVSSQTTQLLDFSARLLAKRHKFVPDSQLNRSG